MQTFRRNVLPPLFTVNEKTKQEAKKQAEISFTEISVDLYQSKGRHVLQDSTVIDLTTSNPTHQPMFTSHSARA
jgi:hypothetical protein